MSEKTFLLFLFFLLLAVSFAFQDFNAGLASAHPQNFTVPTKTPSAEPTDPPPPPTQPSDGGNPTQPPSATNTAVPQTSPTAVIIAPTPEGGYLPTAEACSTAPTLTAQTLSNVRAGPGTAYETVGTLVFLEVRPIVGRASDVAWWQIELPDGRLGWISNVVVEVNGNISVIPVVEAPLLNGQTPTPGVPWVPAIPAGCLAEPTWTAIPPTETFTATSEPTATDVPIQPTETATDTAMPDTPTPESETIVAVPLITDGDGQPTPPPNPPAATAAPLPQPASSLPSSNVIFAGFGVVLLLLIIGIALMRRQPANS